MGLLDDLKEQAASLREQQQVSQAELTHNLRLAHAKLEAALHYWREMFDSLNVIKPVIPRYYYLEGGVTPLDGLQQYDYKVNRRHVTVDHHDYIESIELRMRCAAEGSLTLEKQSAALVKRLREHLWANNLKFEVKEFTTERGYVERATFTVRREVPVTVTLAADLDNARIRIVARNLEKFGEYTYLFDFDEFGTAVLEELGKVILAKPNAFRTMGRHQQMMTLPPTRATAARGEPAAPPSAQNPPAVDDAGNRAKGLIGNIKSLLTR